MADTRDRASMIAILDQLTSLLAGSNLTLAEAKKVRRRLKAILEDSGPTGGHRPPPSGTNHEPS